MVGATPGPGSRRVRQVRDRGIRTVDCPMVSGRNAVPPPAGGRDGPGAQRQQRGDRTAAPDAERTPDGTRYGSSRASRSNMRVRTTTRGGTPTLGVSQEGTTPAEPAPTSGRPVATAERGRDRAQPPQRDARRVPASGAEHNTSVSSPSQGPHGPLKRRGAPSARRRGSTPTTTAGTPSPPADNRTLRSPQAPRPPRPETTAAATPDEKAGPVDEPMTAPADTPPTRPKPTGGARARPLTAAALARRNAKPDQLGLTHPAREPDDRPTHDRTQPDPNGHDPVKPTRRRGTPSTTTTDTPSPPADNRTPQSPQVPRPPRPETTVAAAPDEKAGPVDEPMTAPADTPPTRPKPTGGARARPLTAATLARRNAKPDQLGLTHPAREPDDRPTHDRTQPDPNGHDPVKPTRR